MSLSLYRDHHQSVNANSDENTILTSTCAVVCVIYPPSNLFVSWLDAKGTRARAVAGLGHGFHSEGIGEWARRLDIAAHISKTLDALVIWHSQKGEREEEGRD